MEGAKAPLMIPHHIIRGLGTGTRRAGVGALPMRLQGLFGVIKEVEHSLAILLDNPMQVSQRDARVAGLCIGQLLGRETASLIALSTCRLSECQEYGISHRALPAEHNLQTPLSRVFQRCRGRRSRPPATWPEQKWGSCRKRCVCRTPSRRRWCPPPRTRTDPEW
jgi:hypothetical protein